MRRTLAVIFCFLLPTTVAQLLRADALWTGSPTAAPMMRDATLRVTGIDGDKLRYEFKGREVSTDLSKVTRLAIDAEPVFTAAEDAFVSDKFDAAVDGYIKVIRATITSKPWLADWASRRLAIAADRTGRFDAAVSAYIARLQFEPNPSSVQRPALPDERSTFLDTAAGDVITSMQNPKLSDAQRIALLKFLVDVQRARRDTKAADQAAEKLDEVFAKDPTNPEASRAIARRKLVTAQAAMDKKDWRTVQNEVESNRVLFSEPLQQADALYMLAEAKYQLAAAQTAAGKEAQQRGMRDAALGFMRVVANFKDAPDRPRVTQSLMRVAQIHEQLGDAPTARRLYDQLAATYPDDPNASPARQSAERLKQASPSTRPS